MRPQELQNSCGSLFVGSRFAFSHFVFAAVFAPLYSGLALLRFLKTKKTALRRVFYAAL